MTDNPGVAETSLINFGQTGEYGAPNVPAWKQSAGFAPLETLPAAWFNGYMNELDKKYPGYGFAHHKGYGTKEHLDAIEKLGPIKGIHRYTFGPIREYFCVQEKLF